MAKFCGVIGFVKTTEIIDGDGNHTGVWVDDVQERKYYGDLIRSYANIQTTDKVNNDINLSNDISILCDSFAIENFHYMQYVEFMGTKWNISSVEFNYPRLKLTIGGVYNAQQA